MAAAEERFLEKDERLLDMVAYWQRLFQEEKKSTENKSYRVAFKVRLRLRRERGGRACRLRQRVCTAVASCVQTHMYFNPDVGDTEAERLMYIQAVYDVVSSRYPCNEEDCVNLASLQLHYEYGDDGLDNLEVPSCIA
jgi:hypothetical protein